MHYSQFICIVGTILTMQFPSSDLIGQNVTLELWRLKSISFNQLYSFEFDRTIGKYKEDERRENCNVSLDFSGPFFEEAFKVQLHVCAYGEDPKETLSFSLLHNSKNIFNFGDYTQVSFNAYDEYGDITCFVVYFYSDNNFFAEVYTNLDKGMCDTKLLLTNW